MVGNFKTKKNNSFEKAISVVLIFFIVFLIFYIVTLSWFGNEDYADNIITVGEVNIQVTTTPSLENYFSNVSSPIYLVPDAEYALVTTIRSVANNPAGAPNAQVGNAYIRAKIETTPTVNGEHIVYPVVNTSLWVVDDNNEWYYYKGFINNDIATTATFTTALKVIQELPNNLQGQSVNIKLTVHSIQRQYEVYIGDTKWSNIPAEWLTWASTDNWQA